MEEEKDKVEDHPMFMTDLHIAKKLLHIYKSANSRDIEFDLSFATVRREMKRKCCYYTGIEMNEKDHDPNQRTFDRVDNEKGYVDGNVVACTQSINFSKANLTIPDTMLIVKAYKKLKLI